jgi:type II secretory pathway component GspD/PulD (secretin)
MRFGCKEGRAFAKLHGALVLAGILVSVSSRLVLAQEPKSKAQGPSSPQKVTLSLQGVDILEVLKLLAEENGFNLVAGRNVSGRVTIFVKEVDPWEVMEVILVANELAYERHGQILTVMSQRDYELLYGQPYGDRRVLKTFVPRYVKVSDVSRALAQVKSNIGRVIADEGTNTLILMDTPSVADQMMRLVREMDRSLETRVYSLSYGTVKALEPILQESVTKGLGKASIDERTNRAVVTDYELQEYLPIL